MWRDNGWQEMENLLVEMLEKRDRWMHGFVLDREQDWDALRARLERPFQNAVAQVLAQLSQLLDQVPGAREEALELARFACEEPGDRSPWDLAQCAEIPDAPFADGVDSARETFDALAAFLQTQKGIWRSEKGLKTTDGFPSTPRGRAGKAHFASFIAKLAAVPGIESALAAARNLPPARYTDEDWQIVRACFALLRRAAAELKVVFAEAAAVDYTEVAQIAESMLKGEDGNPTDAAISVADGIRHLLVDEFQDTSRRQHQLLAHLIAAWPEREGRTCFVVGDPMQSIYFFRDADAELFPRVRENGLELPHDQPLLFDSVALTANFRTAPPLVDRLNEIFDRVFAQDDSSGVTFSAAEPARDEAPAPNPPFKLHLNFAPQTAHGKATGIEAAEERESAHAAQIEEIVALIRSHQPFIVQTQDENKQKSEPEKKKYRIAVLGRTRSALAPIAEALRQAAIPFRAVELENLKDRPEILDALALARALLNPQDRVAWLGVLRAPWCGLSLADLHILVSAKDEALLKRPVPELLIERAHLLSNEGRIAAQRVLDALADAPALRFAQPTASLGTWIEQIWLRLGGDACADATARVNLDLLWRCLDGLPNGEQDLLGPALDAALDKLTAQPDPAAETDCGVQLMTIHKSKGLEFEAVIVPELQAGAARTRGRLLSWLERGLPPQDSSGDPDDSREITEFLVAPLQPKGADRGKAKQWVDRVYREREMQEMRRLLYVAATRAREELHLFARPAYKAEKNGPVSLTEPSNSLLATAWPALAEDIRKRFAEWREETSHSELEGSEPEEDVVESIAASGNVLEMPAPPKPPRRGGLRRLPSTYQPAPGAVASASAEPAILGMGQLYERHEGGLLSRALGIAVHALLQDLARLHETLAWEPARAALAHIEPRVAAQVRATGIDPAQAAHIAAQALTIALQATHDPTGQWILSPHADAASEARWAGIVSGSLRTVQVDRTFRAGPEPLSEESHIWWIIDYKTAHEDSLDPAAALPDLRRLFAPQIEAYAQVLRNLHGADATLRAGLYYPRMTMFDWWEID